MCAFSEPFTEPFSESRTESSLWDQGAWNREHGTRDDCGHSSTSVTERAGVKLTAAVVGGGMND